MIAEGPLLETLQAVYTGRLRPAEAYRQIRAAETADPRIGALEARVSEPYERIETHYELITDVRRILRSDPVEAAS